MICRCWMWRKYDIYDADDSKSWETRLAEVQDSQLLPRASTSLKIKTTGVDTSFIAYFTRRVSALRPQIYVYEPTYIASFTYHTYIYRLFKTSPQPLSWHNSVCFRCIIISSNYPTELVGHNLTPSFRVSAVSLDPHGPWDVIDFLKCMTISFHI